MAKSNVCGFSLSTAMSRFCSMARAVTSSSVSSTTRPAGSGAAVGRVWSAAARAAANCCAAVRAISSRRAPSAVSCAPAPTGAIEPNNITATQERMRFFMVVASKSRFGVCCTGLGAIALGRLMQRREPCPLIAGQGLAHVHQHFRTALVEGGPRGLDDVNLLHRRLVAALNELGELCFGDVKRRLQLLLIGQRLLEDLLEAPGLFGGQAELFLELVVLPPLEALSGSRMGEQQHGRRGGQRDKSDKRLREFHR